MMEGLVSDLVSLEWALFGAVDNRGGRADCQDDWETFEKMRASQYEALPEDVLDSWLGDLRQAVRQGRNPVAEKYGYMMARTNPSEYREIEDLLPARSEEKLALVRAIADRHAAALERARAVCPHVLAAGRPENDTAGSVSSLTYLEGELSTLSERTLRKYENHLRQLERQDGNIVLDILAREAAHYGYDSLEGLESALSGQ